VNPGRVTHNPEILNLLLEKADVQGYLTTDDLMEAVPDVGQDSEHLEAILTALRHRGVDILDRETEEEDNNAPESDFDSFSDLESISSDDTISLYLKEMSRVPLLNFEEEQSLAKRIESGRAAKKEREQLNGRCSVKRKAELETFIEDGLAGTRSPDQGKHQTGGFGCQTVHWQGSAVPGPDPGGKSGVDEGSRKI